MYMYNYYQEEYIHVDSKYTLIEIPESFNEIF